MTDNPLLKNERGNRGKRILMGGLFVFLATFIITFAMNYDILSRNATLYAILTNLTEDKVSLQEVVPFEWDAVYSFSYEDSIADITEATGIRSDLFISTSEEGDVQYYFIFEDKVVSMFAGTPEEIGFQLDFTGGFFLYDNTSQFEVSQKSDLRPWVLIQETGK